MWRRLNREDLINSNPLLGDRDVFLPFEWMVYEEYKLIERDPEHPYLSARGKLIKRYEPFVDTPYLFLEFARTAEQRNQRESLDHWIARYGLLGLARDEDRRFREYLPLTDSEIRVPQYRQQGGSQETLAAIREESHLANEILSLYEASLSKDEDKLEQALTSPSSIEDLREYGRLRAKLARGASYVDALVCIATNVLSARIQDTLDLYAFPSIAIDLSPQRTYEEDPLYGLEALYPSWQPRNLLGAIYLQMYWLVTNSGNLSRCKHCGRIISHAVPLPGGEGRKTRNDKEFCDSRCRQNYHYHNRIKPNRDPR